MPLPSESVWDDLQEALRWKPLLPLLKQAREADSPRAKLRAIREAAAFILRQLWEGRDPYSSPAFSTFSLLVAKAEEDPQVMVAVERLLPQKAAYHSPAGRFSADASP